MVNEPIRNTCTLLTVVAAEDLLGVLAFGLPHLGEEVFGLVVTEAVPIEVRTKGSHALDFFHLSLRGLWLVWFPVREMKVDLRFVRIKTLLGWRWHFSPFRVGIHPRMTAVDVGVGEARSGDTERGSGARCPDGVVRSLYPEAEGRATLTDIPSDSREEFDGSSKAEKSHTRKKQGLGKTELKCRRQPRELTEGRALREQASSNPCR